MPRKKKSVLFLGAGMSAAFGYPVTRDILPLIIKKIKDNTLFNDVTRDKQISSLYRILLKNLLISLSPGIAYIFKMKSHSEECWIGLPLVTELLSQLEHLIGTNHNIVDWNFDVKHRLLGKPQKINDRWELANLKIIFDWAIINVINNPKNVYSKKISEFISWIKEKNKKGFNYTTIISTNYDIAFEWELLDFGQAWNADKEIDFGFSWRDPILTESTIHGRPSKPLYRIFKLHGSTDWLKCDRCGFIYINPTEDIYRLTFSNYKNNENSCHCGFWPLRPVLVTPSFVRKVDETSLREVWRNSLEELRTADKWIIIGYSLPSEDFDIRSLFLRALISNDKDLSIKVIQLNSESKGRYDSFLGKDKYQFFEGGFEKNVDILLN